MRKEQRDYLVAKTALATARIPYYAALKPLDALLPAPTPTNLDPEDNAAWEAYETAVDRLTNHYQIPRLERDLHESEEALLDIVWANLPSALQKDPDMLNVRRFLKLREKALDVAMRWDGKDLPTLVQEVAR